MNLSLAALAASMLLGSAYAGSLHERHLGLHDRRGAFTTGKDDATCPAVCTAYTTVFVTPGFIPPAQTVTSDNTVYLEPTPQSSLSVSAIYSPSLPSSSTSPSVSASAAVASLSISSSPSWSHSPSNTSKPTLSSSTAVAPTPAVTTCPTPGIYTIPATTLTLTSSTTVCAASSTVCPPGRCTYGGTTTVVITSTTVTCLYATVTAGNGTTTSLIKTTTYVCPSAGTYMICAMTTSANSSATCVYPMPTSYAPGTYTQAATTVTVTTTSQVVFCPYSSLGPLSSAHTASIVSSSTPTFANYTWSPSSSLSATIPVLSGQASSAGGSPGLTSSTGASFTGASSVPSSLSTTLSATIPILSGEASSAGGSPGLTSSTGASFTGASSVPSSLSTTLSATIPILSGEASSAGGSPGLTSSAGASSTGASSVPSSFSSTLSVTLVPSSPAPTNLPSSSVAVFPSSSNFPVSGPPPGNFSSATYSAGGKKWAITYTPYTSSGDCKSSLDVTTDMTLIQSKGFPTVRIYATDCSALDTVGAAAAKLGLKLILGVYINDAGIAGSQDQVDAIASWAQWDLVEMIVIGNEALFNNYCTATALSSFIIASKAKFAAAGYAGPCTTTEPLLTLQLNAKALCAAVDVVAANLQPYFCGRTAADAGVFVAAQLELVAEVCPGKEAYNLETGWPSAGEANEAAAPGQQEQAQALAAILDAAGGRSVFFSFEDDVWKQPGAFGIEQYWGCVDLF